MVYDTIIVLSQELKPFEQKHLVHPEESLAEEPEQRMQKAVELYQSGNAKTLTMSGGHNFKNRPDEHFTHAYALKVAAVKQGVPAENVFIEEYSMDTVAQAIFSKLCVVKPQGWKHIAILSHDYHMDRVRAIFEFVYGKEYVLHYEAVPSKGIDSAIRERELRSLQDFKRTFEGIQPGDDVAIVKRLFDPVRGHPIYKGDKVLGAMFVPKP